MRLISWLGLGVCLAASQGIGAAAAQTTGAAPGCCGLPPVHDYSQKSMVGTAVNSTSSSVYFTGYEGNVSEIYYPTVDTLATSNLEFLVGDAARTFLDEEKNAKLDRHATRPQIHALAGGHRQRRPQLADRQNDFRRSVKQHADPSDHLRGPQRQDGGGFQPLPSLQALPEERCGEQQRDDGRLRRQCLPGREQRRRLRILRLGRFARLDQ